MKNGFTMLEILLTVGLITALTAVSVPVFFRFESQNNLSVAASSLKDALKTARTFAESNENGTKWGVKVTTGSDQKIVIFSGSSYSGRDTSEDRDIDIVDSLNVNGASNEPEFVYTKEGKLDSVSEQERVKFTTNLYDLQKIVVAEANGAVHAFRYPPSCRLANYDSVDSGETQIDPDADGQNPVGVYCDREVDGGGWTMVARWDRSDSEYSSWSQSLPQDALRTNQNVADNLDTIGVKENSSKAAQTATLNARPLIRNGATEMMHVAREDGDSTSDGAKWRKIYFSQMYQSVRDNPDNLFNTDLDTNDGEGVSGTCEQGFNPADEKQAWYDSRYEELPDSDEGGNDSNYRVVGGEGKAMFTLGNTDGAVYASHNNSSCNGFTNPSVQWGIEDPNGNHQTNTCSNLQVGTDCNSDSTDGSEPAHRLNFMFVR